MLLSQLWYMLYKMGMGVVKKGDQKAPLLVHTLGLGIYVHEKQQG